MTDSYGPIIGSAADKLADSGVAPLVALARGYRSLTPPDVKPFLSTGLDVAPQSAIAKQVRRAVGDLDALMMPWFGPESVVTLNKPGVDSVRPSNVQLRPHPSNMVVGDNGKMVKYVNLKGQSLSLGLHPSTPTDWFMSSEPVGQMMLGEGVIKMDSALSAYLLDQGVSPEDLQLSDGDDSPIAARRRLSAIMASIPAQDRMLMVAFVGVGTWHRNPEWNTWKLDGSDVLVAFDGDVSTNKQVWDQARELFNFLSTKKKANPILVDLSRELDGDGHRMGVDDYLTAGHDWSDLMKHLSTELPEAPQTDNTAARYRMDENTCTMQEKKVTHTESGAEIVTWETKAMISARVKRIVERRAVTPEEEISGRYVSVPDARDIESDCTVEVSWKENDERHSSLIEGPSIILATKPERWTDPRMHCGIAPDVLSLPAWPPSAQGFLEATKGHRRDEILKEQAWTHTGWVPRKDAGQPVYALPGQVITSQGWGDETMAQVDTGLDGIEDFGVDLPDDDEQARNDLRTMFSIYEPCWSEFGHTALVIAVGLRPVVPRPNRTSVLFSGGSGGGKSFSTAAIMAFWQPRPGVWSTSHLPGSASDTPTATEIALSKAPIWVNDDAAPSGSGGNRADAIMDNLGDTIRNIFNGAGKRRATKELGSAKTNTPRALFVASCEAAPLGNQSVMNRLVHVEVAPGFLVPSTEPTNALKAHNEFETTCSRVTGRAIQMVAADIEKHGWMHVNKKWNSEYRELREDTEAYIKDQGETRSGAAQRQSENIAEVLLGVQVLRDLCHELGVYDEFSERIERMYSSIQKIGMEGYRENLRNDLGASFLVELRALLASQKAHIGAAGTPGAPLVADAHFANADGSTDVSRINLWNQQLGWRLSDDKDRPHEPKGTKAGVLLYTRSGEPVVLFDPGAFKDVARNSRAMSGYSERACWDAVWRSGLAVPETEGWKRKSRSGNVKDFRVRAMVNHLKLEGIPIYLKTLLATDDEDDEA